MPYMHSMHIWQSCLCMRQAEHARAPTRSTELTRTAKSSAIPTCSLQSCVLQPRPRRMYVSPTQCLCTPPSIAPFPLRQLQYPKPTPPQTPLAACSTPVFFLPASPFPHCPMHPTEPSFAHCAPPCPVAPPQALQLCPRCLLFGTA